MKSISLVLILIFVASISQAQIVAGFGVKGGTTISNQKWDYTNASGFSMASFESDNKYGINFGIFADIFIIPVVSIFTELNFTQKGMKKDIPITTTANPEGTGEFITWDERIEYINLSALGRVKLDQGMIKPYIVIGPKIDFQINLKSSVGHANGVTENYDKSRFGLKIGLGTEVNLIAFTLLVEILYDYEFENLFENENLKVKTNSLDFRLGILL